MTELLPPVLVTGSSGKVADFIVPQLASSVSDLRLLDLREPSAHRRNAPNTVIGSVTDRTLLDRIMVGIDTVVHLGGIPKEASFDDIVEENIRGTHEILLAAVRHGVRRVVIASSNHAVGFHERPGEGAVLAAGLQDLPDTYYGWSKAAVESLARLFVARFELEVVVVRIGQCAERPAPDLRGRALWLSPADAARLFCAAITDETPGFHMLWGVSNNAVREFSTANTVGFLPHDDASTVLGETEVAAPPNSYIGGRFCQVELGMRMR